MIQTLEIDEQAMAWFIRLSDAEASEMAWLEFQQWLDLGDAHRLAYDAIERLWVDLDSAWTLPGTLDEIDPVPLAVAANDTEPLAGGRMANRNRVGWNRVMPIVAAAAAVVLAVGLWPILNETLGTQVYRTNDEARTVELSDGSKIYLNRHTDLSVRMQSARRTITLADGEAAFDVTHNAARPFVIQAADHEVRVLGTAFNVVNHAQQFSVGVERGVVAVTPSKATRAIRLLAGQRIDQTGSGTVVLSQIETRRASSWRQGVLIYRDAALSEVATDLSRYFDKPVIVSPKAQAIRFTGALSVGDEVTMLGQLQDFVPIRTSRSAIDVRLTARDGQ